MQDYLQGELLMVIISRVCDLTLSASAWRFGGDGFNSRPQPLKVVPTADMSDALH